MSEPCHVVAPQATFFALRSTFASQNLFEHFTDLLEWFDQDASTDSWTSWHVSNLSWIHKLPLKNRFGIFLVQSVPVRAILIISSLAAFEVGELAPVSLSIQREVLSLTLGLGAFMMTAVLFVISYPVSARHMFKVSVLFMFRRSHLCFLQNTIPILHALLLHRTSGCDSSCSGSSELVSVAGDNSTLELQSFG